MSPPSVISEDVQHLPPSSFAFVMATGIISIAAHLQGYVVIAWSLFILALAGFALLRILTLLRLSRYADEVRANFRNASQAPGFLTSVAGTCILGSLVFLLTKNTMLAAALWLIGIALWSFLLYGILAVEILQERKPTLEQGLNGTWLLATVASQSIAILGTTLAGHIEAWRELILFISFSCFLIGGLLYLLIIPLLLYRLLFYPLPPEAMTPPHWIDMGAEAISAVAGATFILHAAEWTVLQQMLPVLSGLTLLFWATATWWIPLLVLIGVWRHVYRQMPFQYSTQYWSLVFPLGTYAVCTLQLIKAIAVPLPSIVPMILFFLALMAWAVTLWGFVLTHIIRRLPMLRARSVDR